MGKTTVLRRSRARSEEVQQTEEPGTEGAEDGEKAHESEESPADSQTESGKDTVFVYVCGAVNSPGVYQLDSDGRVFEAIGSCRRSPPGKRLLNGSTRQGS